MENRTAHREAMIDPFIQLRYFVQSGKRMKIPVD
jgi:hypothetical protein